MIKKEVGIGFLVGLIANTLGVMAYLFIVNYFSESDSEMTLTFAKAQGLLGKIVSMGAVLNLIAFFIFIKKKRDYRARGVLLATVCIAVGTFLIKFI